MPTLKALIPGSLSFEDLGEETDAFLVTGYDTAQSPQRRKISPIITAFMKRTEQWTQIGHLEWIAEIDSGTPMGYSSGTPDAALGTLLENTLPYVVNFIGSDSTGNFLSWDNFLVLFEAGFEPPEPSDIFTSVIVTHDLGSSTFPASAFTKEIYFSNFWRWIAGTGDSIQALRLTNGNTYSASFV